MTQPLLRPPTTLQPRPKANPTFSSSSIGSHVTVKTPQQSRPPSETRQSASPRPWSTPLASDRIDVALIRKVLCPQQTNIANDTWPIDELLPPLSSSNEIDLQLYTIIAIVVQELVYSWYGQITSDEAFVEEVVRIIAHCTRAVEGRLRKIDLESLLLDEIPGLVESHVLAYRISHGSAWISHLPNASRAVYHELNPHPAMSPVPDPSYDTSIIQQMKNEVDYRQLLVQAALAVLLPTEDLENVCLRTLVADVIAESILGKSIGGRVCEGWFVWTSITKLVEQVKALSKSRTTGKEIEVDTRSRLEKFGLLSERGDDTRPANDGRRSTFSEIFWRVLQYGYLTVIGIQFIIVGLFTASWEPRRSSWSKKPASEATVAPAVTLRPLLDFKIFSLLSTILDLSFRMPWLRGSLALMQHHLVQSPLSLLRVGAVDRILDQYLHHLLVTHLNPSIIPPVLSTIRTTLFPKNALPPPPPDPPSPEQQIEIRRHCAETVCSLIPAILSRAAGLSRQQIVREVEEELDVWGDAYLNKHLAYQVLELVILRVLPELGEKGVKELMEARGVYT
ncbi:MAG: hypothetical protein LQ337_001169 [Flavoplaca oasis]|nr:MAG: hypothetical protein LQ337_001169 [Flavoplaca oasis]